MPDPFQAANAARRARYQEQSSWTRYVTKDEPPEVASIWAEAAASMREAEMLEPVNRESAREAVQGVYAALRQLRSLGVIDGRERNARHGSTTSKLVIFGEHTYGRGRRRLDGTG